MLPNKGAVVTQLSADEIEEYSRSARHSTICEALRSNEAHAPSRPSLTRNVSSGAGSLT